MTRPSTYKFHEDPGHGWLQVEKKELQRLKIADKVTPCSYQRGVWAYLEEDCDAALFLNAKKAAGEPVELDEIVYNDDAPCRSYDGYSDEAYLTRIRRRR